MLGFRTGNLLLRRECCKIKKKVKKKIKKNVWTEKKGPVISFLAFFYEWKMSRSNSVAHKVNKKTTEGLNCVR